MGSVLISTGSCAAAAPHGDAAAPLPPNSVTDKNMKPTNSILMILCATALGLLLTPWAGRAGDDTASSFYLKDGDNVCFYGDSITEQRFYGVDVETYVRTRFPGLHVKFVNSGVGGDKVSGGWAGRIDRRLERDVFPFKPNVVTIMLGMNDARYRRLRPADLRGLPDGYEHIIASLQRICPASASCSSSPRRTTT